MDWSNERYVRLYVRDSADMVAVGWEGRLVLFELLRKVDRSGVLEHGGEVELVPEMLRIPHELFLTGFARLVKRKVIHSTDTALVLPNFLAAQESEQSDRQRQSESRKRRMETAMARGASPDEARRIARPDKYKDGSHGVTAGHTGSQRVTPCLAVPSRAEPFLADSESAPILAEGTGKHEVPPTPKRKQPSRSMPEGWTPNEKHAELARKVGVDLDAETANFRDWCEAKGTQYVSWDAGFSTWIRNSQRFGRTSRTPSAAGPKPPPLKLLGRD